MATGYRPTVRNRDLEVVSDSEDITIFKWSRDSYFNELGEALDQLYMKRHLNNGKCTVCNIKTEKFCINCSTHYCGVDCQYADWPKHKVVCEESKLSTQFSLYESFHFTENSIDSKGSEGKDQWIFKGRSDDEKKKHKSDEEFAQIGDSGGSCKGVKSELLSKLETKLENNRKDNCNRRENVTSLGGDELIINREYGIGCESIDKEEKSDGIEVEKGIAYNGLHENEETNLNTYELYLKKEGGETDIKYHENSFSIGDIIEVVHMRDSKDKYGCHWVLQEKNLEALEIITKLLSENLELSSEKLPYPGEIFQMPYNGEPFRVKLITFEPKIFVRCIDTGVKFAPRIVRYKNLPQCLRSLKGLAFPISIGETNLAGNDSFYKATIQVVDIISNSVFKVKVLKVNNTSNCRIDSAQESNTKINQYTEIMSNNNDNENLRRSIFDELEVGQCGIFTSCKVQNGEIFGYLVPDSDDYCKKKIMSLYCMEADKIEAEAGDLVMVPNKENLGQRGLVKSKSEEYGFEVKLIDYGYTVKTFKVYKVPEKARDIMELGVKFNTVNSSDLENFEVNKHYFFEIKGRVFGDKWLCSLKTDSSSSTVFAEGFIGKTEEMPEMKCIPFESGCNVLISEIDKDSPENAFYVRRGDPDWEKSLNKLIGEKNYFSESSCTDFFDSVTVGDLVASKYSVDGVFYRAKVITKHADTACVFFVDYGNKEIARSADLRPLPSFLKERPAFARRVKLADSGSSFVNGNLGYLQKLMDENQTLIMTYDGDISNGVTLTVKGGINSYHKDSAQVQISTTEKNSEPKSSDAFTAKFLEHSCFREGPTEGFVILNLDDKEFMEEGLFWASDLYSNDFNDVFSPDISEHCEKNKEKYFPRVGELCFALYEDGWYRGLVREEAESNFKIFFIDFGNSCFVPSESIRKMVPRFFKTPPAAARCFLHGFHEIPKEKIKSICLSLKDKINETLKDVTIERVNENLCYVRIPEIF